MRAFSGAPGAVLITGILLASHAATGQTAAQTKPTQQGSSVEQNVNVPLISVPSTIVGDPGSVVPLPIRIEFVEHLPYSYVRLWGLPPQVTPSAGNQVEQWWVVPLFRLPKLTMSIPTNYSGRSEIVITLFNTEGAFLAYAETLLVIRSTAMLPTARPPTDVPEGRADVVTPGTQVPAEGVDRNSLLVRPIEIGIENKARAERLVAQGEKYLADANIGVARQFFLRAADLGLAVAALRLAATYDPAELARLQVQGVVPDPDEARKWYERARQLGATEAESRLTRSVGN